MNIALAFPKPQPLALDRPFSLATDAVEITSHRDLPKEIGSGLGLDVQTTHGYDNGGDELDFDVRWSADKDEYENAFKVHKDGILEALAGAKELAKSNSAVAVVQVSDGARYLVPLGLRTEYDESMLTWDDAGGTPYWNGAKDHVLVGKDPEYAKDVEAVVFDGGKSWVNLTGHPIRTK